MLPLQQKQPYTHQKRHKLAEKAELVITALQQRIGEIVSNYETQIAFLRAEITKLIEEKEAKVEAIKEYESHLDDLTAD